MGDGGEWHYPRHGWLAFLVPPAFAALGLILLVVVVPMTPACHYAGCCSTGPEGETCCASSQAPCAQLDIGILCLVAAPISLAIIAPVYFLQRYRAMPA